MPLMGEPLTFRQSRNSLHFVEPKGSLLHSRASATYPCPVPQQSSPCLPSQFGVFDINCILTIFSSTQNKGSLTVEGPSHDGHRPFLPGVDDLSHELRPESNPLSSVPKKQTGRMHTSPPSTPLPEVIENQVDFWPLPVTVLVKDQVQVLRITPVMYHTPVDTHIWVPVIISCYINSRAPIAYI